MTRLPNLSLRWKAALSALLAVALGLLAAGWLTLHSIEKLEYAGLEELLSARTALTAATVERALHDSSQSGGDPAFQPLARRLAVPALARVTVIAPDGTVKADSAVPDEALSRMDNHRSRPEVVQAQATGMGTDSRISETTGTKTLYMAQRIAGTKPDAGWIVRLGLPYATVEARIRDLQWALLIAFGVAFTVSVALSLYVFSGLTRPLIDMAGVAGRLAGGDLGQRVRSESRNEVGVLAAAINQMADQLESKIRQVSEDRAQLVAVLSSMAEGVMVLDCRGHILRMNPAAERMFGLDGEASRGRDHASVIRHQAFNDLVARVMATKQPLSGEITAGPSGKTVQVEASVSGCERNDEACAVFVFHDVTAIRRLEKVRKDFVANVSHELRTPLTSIKGYVEALLDGAKDQPDEAQRFLGIILKQADRLNLIIEDLLQLSQIESGQVAFKQEPVRMDGLVERTVAMIKPLADKKRHEVSVSLPIGLPSVLGDEERLAQVLANLLDNAVKYTPEGGRIVVSGRAFGTGHTGRVELCVADTGVGIPESDRPRVFERFYRVDKARSRELGGTGLGLSIVKHIVEAHHGAIWVEANRPAGSRFVFRLPTALDPTTG